MKLNLGERIVETVKGMSLNEIRSFDRDYDDVNSVDKGDLVYYILWLMEHYNNLTSLQEEDDDDYYGD